MVTLFFLVSTGCHGLNVEMPISEIYELAKNNIQFNVSNDQVFSDSSTVSGFDFFLLQPINGKLNPEDYFKVYREGKTIKKISRFHTGSRFNNYDIFFFQTDGFLFYTVFMFNSFERRKDDGYFVRGFFFRMDYNQFSFFIGLNEGLLPVLENIDENGVTHPIDEGHILHFSEESTIEDIDRIMLLDKNLRPEIRLNYYAGELLSNSRIKYHGDEVYEVLELLPKKSCPLKTGLAEATMDTLFDVISRNGCHSFYQAWVKPDYPNGARQPIWSYNDRYYVYEDLDCLDK